MIISLRVSRPVVYIVIIMRYLLSYAVQQISHRFDEFEGEIS